jgi:hypothetical protein
MAGESHGCSIRALKGGMASSAVNSTGSLTAGRRLHFRRCTKLPIDALDARRLLSAARRVRPRSPPRPLRRRPAASAVPAVPAVSAVSAVRRRRPAPTLPRARGPAGQGAGCGPGGPPHGPLPAIIRFSTLKQRSIL